MSNHLALAAVTEAINYTVDRAARRAVTNAGVKNTVPDAGTGTAPSDPRVHVFLYRIEPNRALANDDLPTRRASGTAVQRPRIALTLDYLLTFAGSDAKLEPHRMFGSVAGELHARPVLSPQVVDKALQAAITSGRDFLKGADLARAVESVRVTALPLSLDELSKVWSVFFQTRYALSAAYRASVVLVEVPEPAAPSLPVTGRHVAAVPAPMPVIDRVEPADLEFSPTATVAVTGRGLEDSTLTLSIGGEVATALSSSATRLVAALPTRVQAGLLPVRVIQRVPMGDPPAPRTGATSNVAALVVRPAVRAVTVAANRKSFQVTVEPPVAPEQDVEAILTGPDAAVTLTAEPLVAASTTLKFKLPQAPAAVLPPARYLLRVQVDGAASLLTGPPGERLAEPEVDLR